MSEQRLVSADRMVELARHAYNEWNLAMAAADGNRQINKCFKMQELCEAVESVVKAAPPIDPETLPIVQELRAKLARYEQAEQEGRLLLVPSPSDDGVLSCYMVPTGKKSLVTYDDTGHLWFNDCTFYEVDPNTIGQYTGRTDKNGEKVFSGDIIAYPGSNKKGLPAEVWYHQRTAAFEIRRIGYNPLPLVNAEYYEVIGNTTDNPELLEGK